MNWKNLSLDNFITFQRGFDLPKEKFKTGPYPVIGSTSVLGYHNEFKVRGPGVVTGRSGTLGNFQYISGDFWPHNTSLWVKDFKENDPKYVYYCLMTLDFSKFNGGGAVPTLNRNVLKNLIVFDVPKPTQVKIASILSAYDDLIENNLRRIKLLEETSKLIYKEWFVNFKFPGHENVKFVDGLPGGWMERPIREIYGKLQSGTRPKGGIDKSLDDGIPSIGAENVIGLGKYNFQSEKFVLESFYNQMNHGKIEDKDILIYKDGAYIGKTTLFQDGFPHNKCCVNEHVFLLKTTDPIYQYFLFFTLNQSIYYDKMQNLNANAAQPGINQESLKSLVILWPSRDTVIEFSHKIAPQIKLIFTIAKENQSLRQARDILLPKLMSGKIEV